MNNFQDPLKNYPKSLDKNEFIDHYKNLLTIGLSNYMATLLSCTVQSILIGLSILPQKPNNLIIIGGGYKNKFLLKKLKEKIKAIIIPQNKLPFSLDFVESELIAYLSGRIVNKLPTTFPSTTGVDKATISGKIYTIK